MLIQWRVAHERHKNEEGAAVAREFELENAGQPRALRSLNLIAKSQGLNTIYKDTAPTQVEEPAAEITVRPALDLSKEKIVLPFEKLRNLLNDAAERIEVPSIVLAQMPVASNDMFVRLNEEEARERIKKPDYDDNEEAACLEEFIEAAVLDYFADAAMENEAAPQDDLEQLAFRHNGPKAALS